MAIDDIDDYKGSIDGLFKILEKISLQARHRKNYDSAVELCAASRSAFLFIHEECVFDHGINIDFIDRFAMLFETAVDELTKILKSCPPDTEQHDHLEGMLKNMAFRILMLRALQKVEKPMEDRIFEVEEISETMVAEQEGLRKRQAHHSR